MECLFKKYKHKSAHIYDENTRYTIPITKCNNYTILMPKTQSMPNKTPSTPTNTINTTNKKASIPIKTPSMPNKTQNMSTKIPMWSCIPKYKFTLFYRETLVVCKFTHFLAYNFQASKCRWRTKNDRYGTRVMFA